MNESAGPFKCRRCDTRFSGWRCPSCGKPLKAIGCLVVTVPTIVILIALGNLIPAETAPRVQPLGDGTVEYCFQSLREAILFPAAILLFLGSALLYGIIMTRKAPGKPGKETATRPDSPLKNASIAVKFYVWLLRLLLGVATLLVFSMTVWTPLTKFRRAVVTSQTVEFHAVMRSWSLLRADISGARVIRRQRGRRENDIWHDAEIVIEDIHGDQHRSVTVSRSDSDPPVEGAALQKLADHLTGETVE